MSRTPTTCHPFLPIRRRAARDRLTASRERRREKVNHFFPTFGDFLAAVLESRKRLVIFRARHSQNSARSCIPYDHASRSSCARRNHFLFCTSSLLFVLLLMLISMMLGLFEMSCCMGNPNVSTVSTALLFLIHG